MNILMVGDVFGSPGRRCLKSLLPGLRQRLALDLVVVNGENASGGLGLSSRTAEEIFSYGANIITTGNHVWRQRDLLPLLDNEPRLLRPANYPLGAPGQGWALAETKSGRRVGVMNLEGRVFMNPLEDPFRVADEILAGPLRKVKIVLVDMHGEASSEKQAMGRYLDGRVSAVLGTHTHVPTADDRILAGGTAYQSDVGLTGPVESVIGMDPKTATQRLRTLRPLPFKVAAGPAAINATLVSVDPETGKATHIERIYEVLS
ncbi:MAG: TIGR00282 family metallophosphoesterase [Proteobacteria bacterium]|nr:TIGR00282 family metallophosphoesterase [Pseudomonadota bacterium]MBU1451444.1 TIGR00282 family metallophosphoesterase [Pseudomonadota bacterium]